MRHSNDDDNNVEILPFDQEPQWITANGNEATDNAKASLILRLL